jgi:hypothetical protein
LWYIDGQHALDRLGFITHGCIDGATRVYVAAEVYVPFTPLKLLRKRIDATPDKVDINWDEYDIDPEDLVVNRGEIDGDNLFYPLR